MIFPNLRPLEHPPVPPARFPECVATYEGNQIIQLPEPIIPVPLWAELHKPFPTGEWSSLITPQSPSATLSRLQPETVPDVVAGAPNRIVKILELGYAEFERTHPLQAHVRQAVRMTLQCRTSALGGHVERCPNGHIARVHYNSCGHRFCPRCAYRKQQTWRGKQRKKLLAVRHFHVTFTIPHEFNDLWWWNFKAMADLLFHTAAKALQDLLKDPTRLGVQVGIVAALHTWDDRLLRHPHLHCLVTGGGLSPEERWKESYKSGEKPFLVSGNALMQRFRRLFCRTLERKLNKEHLKLPEGCSTQQMLNIINKVNRRNWEVYVAKPVEDGGPSTEEILAYQAKAVAGGPLSHMRIEGIERNVNEWVAGIVAGQEPQVAYLTDPLMPNSRFEEVDELDKRVSFRWGMFDQHSGRRVRDKLCTLRLEEFMKRLLWHVTPSDFHAIREYGLYTSAKKAECEKLRVLLPGLPGGEAEATAGKDRVKQDDERIPLSEYMEKHTRCPVCGKKLEICGVIPSSVTGKLAPRDKALIKALRRKRRRGG
jgi:hypothetical protein